MKNIIIFLLLTFMAGCSTTGKVVDLSPEAQIVVGADAITATITLAGVMAGNKVITVDEAKRYRAFVVIADNHLMAADKTLTDCRASTKSDEKTRPDPCRGGVIADIELVLSVVKDVKTTMETK